MLKNRFSMVVIVLIVATAMPAFAFADVNEGIGTDMVSGAGSSASSVDGLTSSGQTLGDQSSSQNDKNASETTLNSSGEAGQLIPEGSAQQPSNGEETEQSVEAPADSQPATDESGATPAVPEGEVGGQQPPESEPEPADPVNQEPGAEAPATTEPAAELPAVIPVEEPEVIVEEPEIPLEEPIIVEEPVLATLTITHILKLDVGQLEETQVVEGLELHSICDLSSFIEESDDVQYVSGVKSVVMEEVNQSIVLEYQLKDAETVKAAISNESLAQ